MTFESFDPHERIRSETITEGLLVEEYPDGIRILQDRGDFVPAHVDIPSEYVEHIAGRMGGLDSTVHIGGADE